MNLRQEALHSPYQCVEWAFSETQAPKEAWRRAGVNENVSRLSSTRPSLLAHYGQATATSSTGLVANASVGCPRWKFSCTLTKVGSRSSCLQMPRATSMFETPGVVSRCRWSEISWACAGDATKTIVAATVIRAIMRLTISHLLSRRSLRTSKGDRMMTSSGVGHGPYW